LAINSAIGGHTPISIVAPVATVPQVREGKLRALAVTGKTRMLTLPNLPTWQMPAIRTSRAKLFGILVPAGTPKEIITLLNREIVKFVTQPDTKDRLAAIGLDPVANTADEFATQIKTELTKWAMVIRAAGFGPMTAIASLHKARSSIPLPIS